MLPHDRREVGALPTLRSIFDSRLLFSVMRAPATGNADIFASSSAISSAVSVKSAAQIFFQVRQLGRSEHWDDERMLGQHPRQRDLRRGHATGLAELVQDLDDPGVRAERSRVNRGQAPRMSLVFMSAYSVKLPPRKPRLIGL